MGSISQGNYLQNLIFSLARRKFILAKDSSQNVCRRIECENVIDRQLIDHIALKETEVSAPYFGAV